VEPNLAAILRLLLSDLYLTPKAKTALSSGRCPDYQQAREVIDTVGAGVSNPTCDYVFNLYHWRHVFAPIDQEQSIAPDPKADLTGAPEFLQQAITQTLCEHTDQVVAWRAGTPKTWGFLAASPWEVPAGSLIATSPTRNVGNMGCVWQALQAPHRMMSSAVGEYTVSAAAGDLGGILTEVARSR